MPACMMRICLATAFPIIAMTTLVGCQGGGGSGCVDVPLGDETECIPDGQGITSLAGTEWLAEDEFGNPIVTLVFDDGGNLIKFADSPILTAALSGDVILDGEDQTIDVGIPLVSVRYSATAGEREGDPIDGSTPFSIVALVDVVGRLFGVINVDVATGTLSIENGSITGDEMTGDFVIKIELDPELGPKLVDLSLGALSLDDLAVFTNLLENDERIPFTATRSGGGG